MLFSCQPDILHTAGAPFFFVKIVPEKGFFYLKKILFYDIIIVQHSASKEGVMAYFLRQEKKRKGTYLQMYESY